MKCHRELGFAVAVAFLTMALAAVAVANEPAASPGAACVKEVTTPRIGPVGKSTHRKARTRTVIDADCVRESARQARRPAAHWANHRAGGALGAS
jgi:hypothetical protein